MKILFPSKQNKRGWTFVELVFTLCIIAAFILSVAVIVGCGYVAYHFISKTW